MLEKVSPEIVGFDAKRLTRVDDAMRRFVDSGRVAGIATRILRKGQLVHEGAYGLASVSPDKPMQPDSVFRIWSMTKAITAAAAMLLYEEGRFTLNQDITEFLPEFKDTPVYVSGSGDSMVLEPRKRPITVGQNMTHTSGLAAGISQSHPIEVMMGEARAGAYADDLNLEAAVKRLAQVPLMYQPDTRWHYSTGLDLIARMVEVISGQPFDKFLQERLFEPLGMHDTGHIVRDKNLDRFTGLFAWDAELGALKQVFSPSESPEYLTRDYEAGGNWWAGGGTGLASTPADYARFGQMLLNGGTLDGQRIFAPRTVALMTANHLPARMLPYNFIDSPPKYGYGHGLGVHVLMDHGEAGLPCRNGEFWKDGGAGTLFWADPALDLVGIVMYQLFDFYRVPVFDTFRVTLYQAIERETL